MLRDSLLPAQECVVIALKHAHDIVLHNICFSFFRFEGLSPPSGHIRRWKFTTSWFWQWPRRFQRWTCRCFAWSFWWKFISFTVNMACFQHPLKIRILMIWARDCDPNEVMEIPEYFVYCGIFIMHSWGKRSGQITKGAFSEVPLILACQPIPPGSCWRIRWDDIIGCLWIVHNQFM